jgi:hypothetical protein
MPLKRPTAARTHWPHDGHCTLIDWVSGVANNSRQSAQYEGGLP